MTRKRAEWEKILDQHSQLRKKANGTLYDRITLLSKVYKDQEYALEMGRRGKSMTELLDDEVSDTACEFAELLTLLDRFPDRTQWERSNLSSLRHKLMEERAQQRQEVGKKSKAPSTRKSATLDEVRHLREECERLRVENKALKEQLEQARETVGTLRETISIYKMDKQSRLGASSSN